MSAGSEAVLPMGRRACVPFALEGGVSPWSRRW